MRYLQHELDADLAIIRETTTDVSRAVDHNWPDVLVGAALNCGLMPKVSWNASLDAGFGGSNGTFGH